MANLEKRSSASEELEVSSSEKEKVLKESKKEMDELKKEIELDTISSKEIEKLIEENKIDGWLDNMKWDKNLEKRKKKYLIQFLNFDYGPKMNNAVKETLGEKTFGKIKAISKKYGSYEKLSDSKKLELTKLLLLLEITFGFHDDTKIYKSESEKYKKLYNITKKKLDTQINKME